MRDEIYATWLHFVKWWIPLSIFLVLIAPHNKGDWMFPHDKGRVSFSMATIFAFVSLTIIAYKFFQMRKK